MTIEQASTLLGYSVEVVERWCDAGFLLMMKGVRHRKVLLWSVVARGNKGSLTAERPDLALQWHPDLNGELSPNEVSGEDRRVVWWSCDADSPHRWQAAVLSRTKYDSRCPSCAGGPQKPLQDHYPDLAAQWHPVKNLPLRLEAVGTGFSKKVWWRCAKRPDHVWQAFVFCRIARPSCPLCTGRIVTPETSLAARFPDLAREWHPAKNGSLRPDEIRPGSTKRIWWRCLLDPSHEWSTYAFTRTTGKKTGCPYCAGLAVTPTTSFAALFPAIAGEWHPTRNGELRPQDIRPGSEHRVWWKCSRDPSHEWCAMVNNRVRGNGCPMCSGRRATARTSLLALYPKLAKEWHPTRNGELTPDKIRPGSKRKSWWQCANNRSHEWESSPAHRALGGSGCPICLGKKVVFSNSLAGVAPELAKEWHPSKNGSLRPEDVYCNSLKRVTWQCSRNSGHVWENTVVSRAKHGGGCPFCAGRVAGPDTSLAARFPEVARDWHPTRNGSLTPDDVVPGSRQKVWWRCSTDPDHEWHRRLYASIKSTGCPICAKARWKVLLAESNRKRAGGKKNQVAPNP